MQEYETILVTGGAGFIGSNFIQYMLDQHPEVKIVNLDALTYAGNLENLKDYEDNPNYVFVKGDVRDSQLIEELFDQYDFDAVVNFAAESHVDRSIEDPEIFLTTNVLGTQNLLEHAKNKWMTGKDEFGYPTYRDDVRFHQVSTDEVYGALGPEGFFTETTALSPNSPYSASKASADMVVRAYNQTFKLPVTITRCSNNYGPYQFPEKLIPLMLGNALELKELPIYGDGRQIRDWLHVLDHCSAIDTVLQKGQPGQIYNVGGNNEMANIEIVDLILDKLSEKLKSNDYPKIDTNPEKITQDLKIHVEDRLGHDKRYAIDNSKITSELGWAPAYTFEEGIDETIDWYLNNRDWLENVKSEAYKEYYKRMYDNKPLE